MQPVVLIVEDHARVRRLLVDWVRAMHPDCEMLEVGSAEAALDMLETRPPDVVLMDIQLPRMNGIEATGRIKAARPETQVVILTIHEGAAYRDQALRAGAYAYVLKSRLQAQLVPVLRALLPGREERPN